MGNEIEIVISSKNRARPAIDQARRDAMGLGSTFQRVGVAIGQSMNRSASAIRDSIRSAVGAAKRDSERGGRDIARGLVAGIAGGVRGALRAVTLPVLADGFRGALRGALSTPVIGPVVTAGLVAAVAAAGPAVATALGGALVLGVGGAVVGIGAALLAQDERIRKRWTSTWKDLKQVMTDAAAPLRPVLETARRTLSSVVKDLAPEIEKGFESAQGPLQRFVRNLGEGFKNLGPSIGPLFESFGKVLDQIGPMLPRMFSKISDAFIDLANTVNENRDTFAFVFESLVNTIPLAVNLVSGLAGAFRGVLVAVASVGETMFGIFRTLLEAVASIPGPWQDAARSAADSIRGMQDKLAEFRHNVENFPRTVKIEGQIDDLESKIAQAKRRLKDPKLTDPERSKIKAEISDLQTKVAAARNALALLRDKNIKITTTYESVYYSAQRLNSGFGFGYAREATGGIIGGIGAGSGLRRFATGGISGSGSSMALVGEQGPEIVRLPVGSSVTPAGQTRSMLNRAGSSISMAFRQGGQGGGGAGFADSMKDLARALRDVVSLREGMSRFTGDVMGQTRALIAYEAAWDEVRRNRKENGRTLNIGREKGRENRTALLGLAEAAHEVAFAMREMGRPTGSIVAKMKEQRAEFIRAARTFGLTSKQARAMADRLGLVPSKVKSVLAKESRDLAYNERAEKYNASLSGKATGGPAGGMTLLGERGPEVVRLPFGSSVVPAGQTAAMLGGAGGTASRPLEITLVVGRERLGRIFVDAARREIRSLGGNVQAVLGSG